MKRKAVHLLMCVLMIAGMLPLSAVPSSAEVLSGSCGENLTWTLDTNTWELNISGTGDMEAYSSSSNVPWMKYREQIKSVTLEEGITGMVGISFFDCTAVTEVTLPKSLEILNRTTFQACDSLRVVTVLNPECQMFWKPADIGSGSAVLCGYPGSTAYECALQNHFGFRDYETGKMLLTWQENEGRNTYEKWTAPENSYLYEENGIITRVEKLGDQILAEQYDRDFNKIGSFDIPLELPLFGGFHAGSEYNYVVFGQANPEEDDGAEVFRTVRYSKDWKRQGAASLYGANTYMPFEAGSLRMTEYGGMLYVHTCHKMYKSSDGLRHQSNVTFSVRTLDMKVTDQSTGVMNRSYGYCSHSFNQFIQTDGNRLLTVDHGDASPRAAALIMYGKPAGQETYMDNTCKVVEALPISGGEGNNYTGVNIGGFEVSGSSYLIAGSSILQDGTVSLTKGQKNIFLTVTDRENFTSDGTSLKWFSSYEDGSKVTVSNPFLVKLNDNRFLLMWTAENKLHYIFVDGRGEKLSKEYTDGTACLSDCQPIAADGKVLWYAVKAEQDACFFEIDPDLPQAVRVIPQHTFRSIVMDATCTEEGGMVRTCMFCGEQTVRNPVPALGHSWNKGKVTKRASYFETGVLTFTCSRCGEKRTETIPVRDISEPCDGSEICPGKPFTDMPPADNWAHAGIDWAIVKNITEGTTETTFGPKEGCTRAQVVTFLWRAAGRPEPKKQDIPFPDVPENAYFRKAVAWAVEEGITKGETNESFGPGNTCTRGQIVTFLWRFKESPESMAYGGNPFADVSEKDFFFKAVLWAAAEKVTAGTSEDTFSPKDTCTRAEVVTFLRRAAG